VLSQTQGSTSKGQAGEGRGYRRRKGRGGKREGRVAGVWGYF